MYKLIFLYRIFKIKTYIQVAMQLFHEAYMSRCISLKYFILCKCISGLQFFSWKRHLVKKAHLDLDNPFYPSINDRQMDRFCCHPDLRLEVE